jgi:IS6 family transposase
MLLLASSVCGLFKWRQFEPEMILLAVGWYLRFSLFVPGRRGVARRARLARRSRHRLEVGPARCPGTGTTFTLETQLNQRQLARGRDLYPGQGQVGVFIPRGGFDWGDHRLPSFGQARHRGRQALSGQSLGRCEPSPPSGHQHRQGGRLGASHRTTQSQGRSGGELPPSPGAISQHVLERDHRAVKRRVRASQHFRSFWGAWRTIAGYEAIHMIRKGQACWSAVGAKVGLPHRFILDLFALTS